MLKRSIETTHPAGKFFRMFLPLASSASALTPRTYERRAGVVLSSAVAPLPRRMRNMLRPVCSAMSTVGFDLGLQRSFLYDHRFPNYSVIEIMYVLSLFIVHVVCNEGRLRKLSPSFPLIRAHELKERKKESLPFGSSILYLSNSSLASLQLNTHIHS